MGIKIDGISEVLKNGLTKLSMLNDNIPNDGLKFISNLKDETNNYIKIHLLEAKKHNAIAVYFRYFENRPPIPQIYIYEEDKLQIKINELHKELWSSCKVPMFFIFSKLEIKIFNSLSKNIKNDIDVDPIETIELASKVKNELKAKNFKARMFDTGEFWNTNKAKKFSYQNSAYKTLLDSLKLSREYLIKENILPENIINSLLMKAILVRYLEERGVFEKDYWKNFSANAESFIQVCEDSSNNNFALIKLFDDLASHFNGGVFKFSEIEKNGIKNSNLYKFVLFLRGDINIKNLQAHFWNLYSFKDLPIELISNIYELFLKNEKGVVYTPSILVDFLIDEMMPLDNPKQDFKVIDPACGSGIFLVGAYKRLVQWWMIGNNFKNKPSSDILKSIIRKNVYGVDQKDEAIELAKFSLSLAICDILSPEAIWNELHFDNLSETNNLVSNDFFNILEDKSYLGKFDLVIGNPPFISKLTTPQSKTVNDKALKENKKRPTLPDNQLALLFLEQSFKLVKKDQFVCMVQPSAFLYNNNVENFRKYLFETYHIKQIIDLAGLNSTLFKGNGRGADVAVSVVFFQNNKPKIEKDDVLHITVRQTFEAREKIYFDLSYYDFHWLNYEDAINNKYIWKCNLLGGNRVVEIVKRMNKYDNLDDYFNKKKELGWYIGEGFQLNGKDKYKENHTADYITGYKTMPADAFNENGIDNSMLFIMDDTHFHRRRFKNKKIFEPPHLLIKEKLGDNKIVCEYRDDYLTFRHDTIGIHAPKDEKQELLKLESRLHNNSLLYLFYLASTSSQAGISRATVILKNDILNFPYPKHDDDLKLTNIEKYFVTDTLFYMFDWIKGTKELPILKNALKSEIEEYQKIYCELLNSIYDYYMPLNILETEQFIITSFYYKNKPNTYLQQNDNLDKDLDNLINNKLGESINIKKILKIYDKNIIYIVKPKQLRFWLKSIAVRDADDTFADLVKMRY